MFKKLLYFTLFSSVALTSACSSLNGLITDNGNTFTGGPKYYRQNTFEQKHKSTRSAKFLEENAERIRMLYNQEYAPSYPNTKLDIKIQSTSSGTSLDLNWKSPTAFFGLGQYDIATTKTHNGREGVAFIDFISDALINVIEQLDDAKMTGRYRVSATLFGQADGTPICSRLIYRGEYGEIIMPADRTRLNGLPHEFHIVRHKVISNEELAAIRAYSIASYIRGALYNVPIEEKYNISVVKEKGILFRNASVKIEIMEKH